MCDVQQSVSFSFLSALCAIQFETADRQSWAVTSGWRTIHHRHGSLGGHRLETIAALTLSNVKSVADCETHRRRGTAGAITTPSRC